MEAEIVLTYDDQREAEAVASAVTPDNVKVPNYLSIETVRSGKQVVFHVRCEENRLRTFISTIDDLLGCVSVVEKVFSALSKMA